MRPSSITSVPGDSTRSGSTSEAPDSTIIGAARCEPGRADGRGVGAERRGFDAERIHHRFRQPPRDFDADRFEQQIGGRGHDAAEDEHLRIGDHDQVRRRHAEILRGIAHDRDRTPSPARAAVEHVVGGDRRKVAVDRIVHARAIAGLDPPDDPPDDAGGGDFGFETAGLAVVFALDRVQRQPGDRGARPRAPLRATPSRTMPPRAMLADREEDHILHAAGGADPRFGGGSGGARLHRAVFVGRPANRGASCDDRRGYRRRVGVDGGNADDAGAEPSRRCDLIDRAAAAAPQVAGRIHLRARHDAALLVDRDGDRAASSELETDHSRPQSLFACSLRPSSGSATRSSASRMKQRAIDAIEQARELALVGRVDHEHAAAASSGKRRSSR